MMYCCGLLFAMFLLICPLQAVAADAALDPAEEAHWVDYQRRVATMLELRTRAYRFAQDTRLLERAAPQLTREQSNQLRSLARQYLEARAELLPEALKVSELFRYPDSLVLSNERATNAHDTPILPIEAENGQQPRRWINPQDAAGRRLMLDIQRGLAAGMVLMDSYRIAVEPYAESNSMRYLLTYDVASQQSLRQLANNYHAPELRARLAVATRLVDDYMAGLRQRGLKPSAEEDYLYGLTQSTLWYAEIRDAGLTTMADTLLYLSGDLNLRGRHLRDMMSHGLSMGFGNLTGLVQTRRGRLARMPDEEMARLARELKPLDILLEKTPFRLTDKLIPGHYGHVAVWLGSEDELRALGIWEQIKPAYQQQIRNGGRIVEALRGGVVISSLRHFLNIDDLLVLRDQRPMDQAYRRQAVLTALEQVGKEYDFNFDVYTHSRIVCSELAYVVFPDVPWPLARTLGRYTISPDNVAQMAVKPEAEFAPAVLYRDGVRFDNGMREMLAHLIGAAPAETLSGVTASSKH